MGAMMRAVALTASGWLAGILLAGALTAQAMVSQPAEVYAQVARTTHQTYALPMMVLQLAAIAAVATLLIRHRRLPVAVALLCLLTVLTTTLLVNVPINGQMIEEWPVRIPSDWAQIRDRWNTWHGIRTGLSVIAFGCLAAWPGPRRAGTAG